MPKRDAEYMKAQREELARAARGVLLEKGYYEATSREICLAAGISNGALYNHFPAREAIVIAASALAQAETFLPFMPASWEEYIGGALRWLTSDPQHEARRFRLSKQFAAEIAVMDRNPEGISELFREHRQHIEAMLLHLQSLGIITMPLGVRLTAEMHSQIAVGAEYYALSNHDADRALICEGLEKAFAMTAGLVTNVEPASND